MKYEIDNISIKVKTFIAVEYNMIRMLAVFLI